MATTNETTGAGDPTVRQVNGTETDKIEKESKLTHTTTNISLSPELFEKVEAILLHGVEHS